MKIDYKTPNMGRVTALIYSIKSKLQIQLINPYE